MFHHTSGMDFKRLHTFVRRRGGIVRVTVLRELGAAKRLIDGAVHSGQLLRPIRGWVCLPDTDEQLILAARERVVLSCVSQAKRLDLWVKDPTEQLHVAVPSPGAKVRAEGLHVHWGVPMRPRHPGTLLDPIENVLGFVAACQPFEDALTIWNSALNKRLVDLQRLSTLHWKGQARRLLNECTPFADSGLESLAFSRLSWLPHPIRRQTYVLGHRIDLLIGKRLILQIDGAHHTGAQRTSDIAHDAELIQLGYSVIRVSYEQVIDRWEEVQELILGAIARGAHR